MGISRIIKLLCEDYFVLLKNVVLHSKKVKVIFLDFYVEQHSSCRYDNLTLYNGPNFNSPRMGVLCGSQTPDDRNSSGRYMYIVFKTDYTGMKRGFSANVKFIEGRRLHRITHTRGSGEQPRELPRTMDRPPSES